MLVSIDTDCPPVMDYIASDFVLLDSLLADIFLTSGYSKNTIVVANAYGLTNDIRELKALKNNEFRLYSTDSIRLLVIEKAFEIDKTLNLATLEIQTLQTFMNCNNLKLIRAKTDLEATNNKTRSAYTNSAIIIGVGSSVLVAGAVMSDGDLNSGDFKDWVGIAGGLVAAGLAVISERVNKKVSLSHEHNAIAAIWNGDNDQGVFTDNTWYLINQPCLTYSSGLSMREQILNTWKTSNSLLREEIKHNIEEISRLLSMATSEVHGFL